MDDAAGEAFDKTAKLLGLPYPGGALLSELAKQGRPGVFTFPRPMLHSGDLNMSFSGLKTAVLTAVNKIKAENTSSQVIPDDLRNDICREFQDAVVEVLSTKAQQALKQTHYSRLVVAGGVGANWQLRDTLNQLPNTDTFFPPMRFCTDNGAMIAFAGAMHLQQAKPVAGFNVKPRWPLSDIVSSPFPA